MRKISVSEAVSADSAESITGETGGIYMREREEGIREQGHGASLAPAAWKANEMRLWLKERMATHVRDAAEKLTDFEIQMVFAGIFYGISIPEAAESAGISRLQAASAYTYARKKMRKELGAEEKGDVFCL